MVEDRYSGVSRYETVAARAARGGGIYERQSET